jgi:subtilisin family serine protease/subtilisin-like proprotein convertase family protein
LLLAGAVSLMGTEASAVETVDVVTYSLKTPRLVVYSVDSSDLAKDWARGHEMDRPGVRVKFGSRVVLQLAKETALGQVMLGSLLKPDREFAPGLFLLQAPNVKVALEESERLTKIRNVLVSHPVRQRLMRKTAPMAKRPNDPLYDTQWPLENRDPGTGDKIGPEFNIREAWAGSTGQGVVIGIADDGVDLAHTDFLGQGADNLHFNFTNGEADGNPAASNQGHGTIVAGLALAKADNKRGIAGVSPGAKLASLVVWTAGDDFGTEEQVADMFQYRNDAVHVQNHSWGSSTIEQLDAAVIESKAIERAIETGRDGKGVLIIRVSGNSREEDWSASDDGYANDPRVVTVGAVGPDGRVAPFSSAGACVLCVGLIANTASEYPVYSTDRMGALGWNRKSSADDPEVGSYHAITRGGTSFTAPQLAGVVALILGVNPDLTYRDVQQVLIHSSRHYDFDDPFLSPNASGYLFSLNTGYGVPDAGVAVRLAKSWKNTGALVEKSYTQNSLTELPDDGLQLRIVASGNETIFTASPGNGLVYDDPTEALPLVDVGKAIVPLDINLTGKAALIERGGAFFSEKVLNAAEAGAEFAVIYNHRNGNERFIPGGLDFTTIPAVFLSQNDGMALKALLNAEGDKGAKALLSLDSKVVTVAVPDSLLCEQIGVRVKMTHRIRSDIRLTVRSPSGTRSVLQANVPDGSAWRGDWTFWSNQFFYEPSKGDWSVAVSDLAKNFTGVLSGVELAVRGRAISDTDNDGLDDDWETAQFGTLAQTALEDPDRDGVPNAREQALHTDPETFDGYFDLRYLRLGNGSLRLAWPNWRGFVYRVQSADYAIGPWTEQAVVEPGQYQTSWETKSEFADVRFYRVLAELEP